MCSFEDTALAAGKLVASAPFGEEVVISGIAGYYPNSRNSQDYFENLLNKIYLCDDDERRYKHNNINIPKKIGKLYDIEYADTGFFGIHRKHAAFMDPCQRLYCEKTYEALADAGISLAEIEGTNTGVFNASCFIESQSAYCFSNLQHQTYPILGTLPSVAGNRVSHFFKLNGPTYSCDSACSSSTVAFEEAYRAIRNGRCNKAIVIGNNTIISPHIIHDFYKLGILSNLTQSSPFDDNSNGYVRAEGLVVVILERKSDAKRIYAEVVHSKSNCDGFKADGIMCPSQEMQSILIKNIYTECGLSPEKVCFVEAHCTGTIAGDIIELNSLDEVFCGKNRRESLYIGSVKSNVGHTEPVSALISIIKIILAMNSGKIPPNINYNTPRKGSKGLESGRLKVVTEITKWPEWSDYAAVNSFGFGGTNAHVVLKRHLKKTKQINDGIPRLVCFSGSTKESLILIQKNLALQQINYEYIGLLHNFYKCDIPNANFRGFIILSEADNQLKSITRAPVHKKPLHLCIGNKMADDNLFNDMLKLTAFQNTISTINKILKKLGKHENCDQITKTICVQIGIINILKDIEIVPKYITGWSFGELTASYARDELNLENTVAEIFKSKKFLNKSNQSYHSTQTIIINMGAEFTTSKTTQIDVMNTSLDSFLYNIGRLYELGYQPQIQNLYSKIQWPVSCGTPLFSHLIKWNHNHYYPTAKWSGNNCSRPYGEFRCVINTNLKDYEFMKGHVIDGQNIFPTSGYLLMAWTNLCICKKLIHGADDVCFKNVKFHKSISFGKDGIINFTLHLQSNGDFEISENDAVVTTGNIKLIDRKIQLEPIEYKEDNKYPKCFKQDIYQELHLRGYNYKGEFCAIHEYTGSNALIEWTSKWETFLENMLQLTILNEINLSVPIKIDQIVINAEEHMKVNKTLNGIKLIPVYIDKHIIRTNHIEIIGLKYNRRARRSDVAVPILESYKFISNINATLTLEESARINTQIVLENENVYCVKVLELIEDKNSKPLSPLILKAVSDIPTVQSKIKIITQQEIELNKEIEMGTNLLNEKNYLIFIGKNILDRQELIQKSINAIIKNGFIIAIEETEKNIPENLVVLTKHLVENKFIYLLRQNINPKYCILEISNNLKWVDQLKTIMENPGNILLYSQDEPTSGILGLIKCLRCESNGNRFFCVFIQSSEDKIFDLNDPLFGKQMKKGMTINVLQNGNWGTYRHLLIMTNELLEREHCYANVMQPGNLSSLKWIGGPLKANEKNVLVHKSGLNFRDLMLAKDTSLLNLTNKNRLEQEYALGIEYSGVTESGDRVMGIIKGGGISTLVKPNLEMLWKVPDNWSLEDAATVPVVYATVLIALKLKGNIKEKKSILIHSATDGMGLAAINIALYHKMNIFVTVGTKTKREYLRKHYPQISNNHIGNSKNTSFENMIFKETNGRGVDYVLNSLSKEKLLASVRCLAHNGTFLEIGKYDLSLDNPITREFERKNANFVGVMLDTFHNASNASKEGLNNLLKFGIKEGFIKPLPRVTYQMNQLEEAYRLMDTGNYIGKIVLNLRSQTNSIEKFWTTPRFYFNPNASYIILGGLGGFGLELADWMGIRGAKYLTLSSRHGLKNGYQQNKINKLKLYGVHVEITTENISTKTGCINIINAANFIAPIEGVFNLAVELKDGVFENLSQADYETSLKPKAIATKYFDEFTRKLCPNLKQFVVFSSVTSGRGNAGQTNYGYSNSVMERICEKRKQNGYPALAIQWGAIGDVGLLVKLQKECSDVVIAGTLQQKISSCLAVMDRLLTQNETVVTSMILAPKKKSTPKSNTFNAILEIMGITDVKTISTHSSFPELGMDSITSVKIKQILELDYSIFITLEEIKTLTISKLMKLMKNNMKENVHQCQ